jgi:hypothetical protein
MDTTTDPSPNESSPPLLRPRATRYEPSRNDACLVWKEQDGEVKLSPPSPDDRRLFALLLDISQTGASVALDDIPHPSDGVRLRIEGGHVTDWTEAEVVGVTTTTQGPHLVRLAFRTPCTFETLLAAICG